MSGPDLTIDEADRCSVCAAILRGSSACSCWVHVQRPGFQKEGDCTWSMMLGPTRLSVFWLGFGATTRPYVANVDGVPLRNVRGRERRFPTFDGAVASLRRWVSASTGAS